MELELPNDCTCVGWMLEAIKDCPDKDVAAVLAAIRLDGGIGGMRRDCERTVTFLLPTDSAKKIQKDNKRDAVNISAVNNPSGLPRGERGNGDKTSFKISTGSTSVKFWYYKLPDFKKLSIPQQKELTTHIKANGNYVGSWTGKYGGTRTPAANDGTPKNHGKGRHTAHAQVASLLTEHDA